MHFNECIMSRFSKYFADRICWLCLEVKIYLYYKSKIYIFKQTSLVIVNKLAESPQMHRTFEQFLLYMPKVQTQEKYLKKKPNISASILYYLKRYFQWIPIFEIENAVGEHISFINTSSLRKTINIIKKLFKIKTGRLFQIRVPTINNVWSNKKYLYI